MNTFTLLDPTHKDEDGIIRFHNVAANIIDFRGDRDYYITIHPMEARILKEKEDRIQFQFNGRSRTTIKKKSLAKNKFGEVYGFNPFGIGSSLSCYHDEIDITIKLCIEDMWRKIETRDNIPDWVFDFKDKEPAIYGKE
jgi:hypothetical protein